MDVEFKLQRRFFGEKYTIGKLSCMNEPPMCDTLEDRVRDYNHDGDLMDAGETKIFGETAIPFGRYPMTVIDSPHFKRRVPLLHNVKHFDAIEIHAGNTPEDTHGCILAGENKVKGQVINSRYWENFITQMIERFIANGDHVYINIV